MLTPATTEAGVSFSVSILGEMQLERSLAGRIRATSDLSHPFGRIADDIEESQERRFDREGSHDGSTAWKPLSAAYAAWKAQHYPGTKTLVRTGELRDALTGGPGSTREIAPLRMVVGGTIQVGAYDLGSLHFTGTTRGMPARRPMALGRQQRHRWMRFLADHFRIEGKFND